MSAPRSEALLAPLELFGIRLGLERVRRLLAALGSPHRLVPVVLVAGTNGKGSTAALLAAMCRAAGYRTGLYTSPHLEAVTERLAIDGRSIDDRDLAGHLEAILAAAGPREAGSRAAGPPTYFEALTVAAFRHFAAAGAEIAVLEVGLGGRLDATNAGEPVLSLITSIARDHEEHLGTGLAAVAGEKAGILRRGTPAIAWTEEPEAEAVLRARAREIGSELVLAADRVRLVPAAPAGVVPQRLSLETGDRLYEIELHLAGRHQLQNLAVAVLAAETLAERGFPRLDAAAIAAGAGRCRWPGRLEDVDLPGGGWVTLDAAHNPAAAAALADWMRYLPEPPDLLFGAMGDKAVESMLPALAALAGRVFLTRPPGRRAADPRDFLALISGDEVVVEPDPGRALDAALAGDGGRLLVCGSIYLVGEVRGLLRRRFGVPPADQ